jgi:hypothetical protein
MADKGVSKEIRRRLYAFGRKLASPFTDLSRSGLPGRDSEARLPDCEAKRELRPGVWQRVRIEFEFRSRTFYMHGHDPRQGDVIVCWENNWPECPIEVQELKSLLPRLSA